MQDRVFIDSNIWVYFFLESPIFEEEEKYRRAFALISLLDKILASTQVLNETANVLLRKYKFSIDSVKVCLQKMIDISDVIPLETAHTFNALELMRSYSLAFYDALIVSVALSSNCRFIYSEDLQHRLTVENQLVIQNPFVL
jgi:predicted nucleic acid-binding protein